MTRPRAVKEQAAPVAVQLVDTDVHPAPTSDDELRSFLPKSWSSRHVPGLAFSFGGHAGTGMPPGRWWRDDAIPASGGTPGSDPNLMERQLLREAGVDLAILIPIVHTSSTNAEYEAAVCAAANEWQHQLWLGKYNKHGRYRGSILVSSDTGLAVEEIEKWAGHPYFVQVKTENIRGRPMSLFQAAAKNGLAVAFHGGGMGTRSTLGPASYYLENHIGRFAGSAWNNLESFVFDGIFERIPELKVVILEAGFSWAAPFIWRMDRHWQALRSEVPWVKRQPSEYIREHVRFSSQPIEEPADPKHFEALFELIGAQNLMMFSTDYPHWDYDDPKFALSKIPDEHRKAVMAGNALSFYGMLPQVVDALPEYENSSPEGSDFPASPARPTSASD